MDIKYIKDNEGNKFFPLVHEKGVVDNNGTTLESKLLGKQDVISNIAITVDNNTGTPAGNGSINANTLTLSFVNLKGAKGDTGVAVDSSDLVVKHTIDSETTYQDTDIVGADAVQEVLGSIENVSANVREHEVAINGEQQQTVQATLNTTQGTIITQDSQQQDLHLDGGKTYVVSVVGGDTNKFTIYFRNAQGSVSCTFTAGTTTNTASSQTITSSAWRNFYITPSADVTYVRFYASASDIKETSTISITFNWTPTDKGLVEKTEDLEDAVATLQNTMGDKLSAKTGKNLFNKETITTGKFFNVNGVISSTSTWAISDYIPIKENTNYYIGYSNAVGSSSGCHVFYNESKTKLSVVSGGNTNYESPVGAKYIRISIWNYQDRIDKVMVVEGDEYGTYESYSPIGGYDYTVKDESVTYAKLGQDVKNIIGNSGTAIKFKAFTSSATLANGEILRLPAVHINNNICESVKIYGTFTQIQFGVGITSSNARTYEARWFEVDATEVRLYNYDNVSNKLLNTYNHGLTLTSQTILEIDTTRSSSGSASITFTMYDDYGNSFIQELSGWGVGVPFVQNDSSNSIDVTLSFMPRDLVKKIWCFGDSYFNFASSARWTYYFAQKGMANWLSNNQPGLSPTSAYNDLQNLLTTNYKPTYILWCLGMNGATTESQVDGEYVINSAQKEVIDNVVALCNNYDIELVLATIPTVPERQKTGFCNYVRSLGVRYVDFAKAVGANSSGEWNAGLLSSDEVHPSVAGGKVLASQVFVDFPEITIID